jgi:hypothetical protein
VARVEFTSRAEQSILDLLGHAQSLEEALLVVEVAKDEGEASLSVHRTVGEKERLQRDINVVGPFRVALGGERVSVFVRGPEQGATGRYELDYYACGGRKCFQIRPRDLDAIID